MWRCSDKNEDGVYYLPNFDWIGWTSIINATNDIGNFFISTTYAYPIPEAVGCVGTVSVVQFCYRIPSDRIGNAPSQGYLIFNMSTLSQSSNMFTVINVISVYSIPDNVKRTEEIGDSSNSYCCEKVTLETEDHFQLPQEDFALGIMTPSSSSPNLQRFETMFRLEHFQQQGLTSLLKGTTYNFGTIFVDELRTLRLHLSECKTIILPKLTQVSCQIMFNELLIFNISVARECRS